MTIEKVIHNFVDKACLNFVIRKDKEVKWKIFIASELISEFSDMSPVIFQMVGNKVLHRITNSTQPTIGVILKEFHKVIESDTRILR